MSDFIHLHNHSHYSLLDGAATIEGLIASAVEHKMPSVALTDHGVMFGAVEFYNQAKKAGIKPIIGCEVYIVMRGTRFERDSGQRKAGGGGKRSYNHLVLLAKNQVGYKNLMKLVSIGHTEGFYYKPRIDVDVLRQYHEGLICLSACPAGAISEQLIAGNMDEARNMAITFMEIFGNDFYLEIQDHKLAVEKYVLDGMPRIAKELGVKLIATNDVHYIKHDHAVAHNVMLMIPEASAGNTYDYKSLRYQTDQIFFKSPAEMVRLFKDYPGAIESTLEVAEKIEKFPIGPDKPIMPDFPIPEDAGVSNLDDYFEKLARNGLDSRYSKITDEISARIDHEIAVIRKMGYAGYFMIVQDFINAAKKKGISVGPGRGSAAGSLVSYALGITDVDPLKYDLLFERFLNPDRVSMPDIDVDFADNRREEVIQYVKERYGADSVSQIITFGTLSSRAVIKDVARVIGVSLQVAESITKQIPVFQGKVTPIKEAINTLPDLKWVKDSTDPKIQELIQICTTIEGMNRNSSTHAAGVVIAPGPIANYVPVYKTPTSELMTQYSMIDLEYAGMLKMDFLGLRTLTILDNALTLIERNHGVRLDLLKIPEDDAKTFELFGKGHTIGIFQFESTGMRDWLRKLKPNSINDLTAMNALYRPGPMDMIGDFILRKQGKESKAKFHPKVIELLPETYGVIVYQEQVMRIASEIAGFTLAKADIMRRAMGKKDAALMNKQKQEFIDGAVARKFPKKDAGEIFDNIEKFAAYGFNKSHSVAYSVVAFQTGYLKTHYPAEYMAACMSAEIGDTDYVVELIEECRNIGIEVLPPDVNESGVQFEVVGNAIRFGLSAIKNVGTTAVENIIRVRQKDGRFKNLFDFCGRVELRLVNKRALEALIQAGAFDSTEGHRGQLFETVEKAIAYGQNAQGQHSRGQSSLFGGGSAANVQDNFPPMPESAPWTESERLTRERAAIGFYVSGHPLKKYEREVLAFSTASFGAPDKVKNGQVVRLCGIVTTVKKTIDRKGKQMAFLGMEDYSKKGECIVFSEAYSKFAEVLNVDAMVMVVGKAEQTGDSLKIFVSEVFPMDQVRKKFTKGITVSVRINDVPESAVGELKKVAEKNKGKYPFFVRVFTGTEGQPPQMFTTTLGVDGSDQFVKDVEKIFGPRTVQFS